MTAVVLPRWEDDLVRIEPMAMVHLDFMIALRADAEVRRYVARDPFASREEASTFLQKILTDVAAGSSTCWLISDRATGSPIGTGGIWRLDRVNDIGEVGYSILPAWWGKGYVRRALAPMLDYAFAAHALHRVEANIDPRNARSAGLLQRLGFRHEASFRENYKYREHYLDSHIYALLRADWNLRTTPAC